MITAVETLSLAGKVAIVTGSGRENGIGAGIARALARNGAAVTIHYLSPSSAARAEKTAQSIRDQFPGAKAAVVQADITSQEGAQKLVKETLEAFGAEKVDILVNNAGAGVMSPLLELTPEHLQHELAVNINGSIFATQAVVSVGNMPRGGRIVNIGTVASKLGVQGVGLYAATKAAVDSLTASWAGELGRSHGITVNTVAPGPVITDMLNELNDKLDGSKIESAFVEMTRAEDRVGRTEDIADAVLLLVQEKARWITAQFISVSGGITGTMG